MVRKREEVDKGERRDGEKERGSRLRRKKRGCGI